MSSESIVHLQYYEDMLDNGEGLEDGSLAGTVLEDLGCKSTYQGYHDRPIIPACGFTEECSSVYT